MLMRNPPLVKDISPQILLTLPHLINFISSKC
jgi:hypothetical protein